jgi:hypothetical protein
MMNHFIKNAWQEIQNGENIDTYLALVFGVVGAVIGIVGANSAIVAATASGVLSLLAFGVLQDRRIHEKLADMLGQVEEKLQQPTITDIDDILQNRSDYPVSFKERIKGAHTLWIYAASAINIMNDENLQYIREHILSRSEGELRIIVQDPSQSEALRLLKKQVDDSVDFPVEKMDDALPKTIDRLKMVTEWKCKGTFEYRLLASSPGFSLVVIDPEEPTGLVIPEFYAYHNEHTGSRMHIEITRDKSLHWYDYWVGQFTFMWAEARQPGSPPEPPQS